MLLLLSPSKKLDEKSTYTNMPTSEPVFMDKIDALVMLMKKKSVTDIAELMHLSDKLAELNYTRYQDFYLPFTPENTRPALFTFKGDVYEKMDVAHYTEDDLKFANAHVRILSGLYGVLKPLDRMQPYRLEMGTKLENPKGKNLYAYWGSLIAEELNKADADVVINLASGEYYSAVDERALKKPVITINFKHLKNGKLKTIGLMAKRARGLMADYVIKNKITHPAQLKNFSSEGYVFVPESSLEHELTFVLDMDK